MKKHRRVKIGVMGCGAIGSRMAKSITRELKKDCQLAGLYDIQQDKSLRLARQLKKKGIVKNSLSQLLKNCDFIVEAV